MGIARTTGFDGSKVRLRHRPMRVIPCILMASLSEAASLPVTVSESSQITTIEGLSNDGSHPVQQAWAELDVPQCGYCQPGMIMAVAGMLNATPNADDAQIDNEITNICRCGTFQRVREGVHLAKSYPEV